MLLSVIALSVIIPIIEIPATEKYTEHASTGVALQNAEKENEVYLWLRNIPAQAFSGTIQNLPNVPSDDATETNDAYKWIIIALYLSGIVFFIGRQLYSLRKIFCLLQHSNRQSLTGGITLIQHSQPNIPPFSWLKYIVVAKESLLENELPILTHETAHIQKLHSFDLLLADICILLQWFNPAAWLLKQELQQIHEYEADSEVLKQGIDAKQYQLLLIKKAVGPQLYSMACGFNQNNLKKRIAMMLKKKSRPAARLKALLALPLTAFAVVAFAKQTVVTPDLTDQKEKTSFYHSIQSENVKSGGGGPLITFSGQKFYDGIYGNVTKSSVEQFSVLAKPVAQKLYGDMGKNGVLLISVKESESSLQKKNSSENKDKEQDIAKIKNEISAQRQAGKSKKSYILIDGKVSSVNEMAKLDLKKIQQFVVLEDSLAIDLFGNKGKNGAIIINQKTVASIIKEKNDSDNDKKQEIVNIERENPEQSSNAKVGIINSSNYILIDGKESSIEELTKLAPGSIEQFAVLQDSTAYALYGKKGKNGVISVTLKKENDSDNSEKKETANIEKKNLEQFQGTKVKTDKSSPYILLDGKESSAEELAKIAPESIKQFAVLQDSIAYALYGEKAKNGVISVTLEKKEQ